MLNIYCFSNFNVRKNVDVECHWFIKKTSRGLLSKLVWLLSRFVKTTSVFGVRKSQARDALWMRLKCCFRVQFVKISIFFWDSTNAPLLLHNWFGLSCRNSLPICSDSLCINYFTTIVGHSLFTSWACLFYFSVAVFTTSPESLLWLNVEKLQWLKNQASFRNLCCFRPMSQNSRLTSFDEIT